jgi:hypothetical protein
MFRGIVNGQSVPKPSACLFPEAINQRFSAVDIKVVHDEMNDPGVGITVHDVFYDMGELNSGPVTGGRCEVPTTLRFYYPKYIGCATPFVLVVRSRRLTGSHWSRGTDISM